VATAGMSVFEAAEDAFVNCYSDEGGAASDYQLALSAISTVITR